MLAEVAQIDVDSSSRGAPALSGYQLAPRAVVLSEEHAARLARAAEGCARLLVSVLERFFEKDAEACAEYFGAQSGAGWLGTLLERLDPRQLLFRADLIDGADGPKLAELNGPNAGGWVVSTCAEQYLEDGGLQRSLRGRGLRAESVDTAAVLLSHLTQCSTTRCSTTRCSTTQCSTTQCSTGMADGARDREFHLVIVIERDDREFGPATRQACRQRFDAQLEGQVRAGTLSFAGWDELRFGGEGVELDGRRVDAIFEEAPEGGATRLRALREARRGRVHLFYGPLTALLNDKRNLALLHEFEQRGELTPEDSAMVRDLIPWTVRLSSEPCRYAGEVCSPLELARRDPTKWVLKRAGSHGGHEVLLGCAVPETAWHAALTRASLDGDWVLQRYVAPKVRRLEGDPLGRHCVWGVFVIGGRAAGGFGRLIAPTGYARFESSENPEEFREFVMERSWSSDRHALIVPIIHTSRGLASGLTEFDDDRP